uniref:Mediator of RNA polymerase II transcription subunit 18 n=1 Tax=Albugo laibachii Nc14 TaxID=890382 RepID=F0WHB6_9STRA|nr:conserved hypothetical protein [Albugo laibachii Nc14]|eukprot:CCA20632.1 conserved hypothetical protein [Albugo laibachii Nc14]
MARSSKCFEVVLQGEVNLKDFPSFIERVQGLRGASVVKEDMAYKEYVYKFDAECPFYIQGVPHYEVRARHVFSGSLTCQGEIVEMPPEGAQKWELRYLGRWEQKKISEQATNFAVGVPYRSQIAVSTSQNVCSFLQMMGFRQAYQFMRLGTRWQLGDGIMIEATRIKALETDDPNEEFRMVDLENLRVEAFLVEISALTSDENIDVISKQIRRFTTDLIPLLIERPLESKDILSSTATLAAEMRRKRPRS